MRFCFWLIWRVHNADFLHSLGLLKRPFCATWLPRTHTAAFVLQIHPCCAAFRRGKESSRTSVKFKPANKRRGCSKAAAFVDIRTESWWKMMHAFTHLKPGNRQSKGPGGRGGQEKKNLKKGLEKTFPSWGLNKRDWTRRKSSYARRGSAARSAGDGWRRAAVTEISIFVIYHFLLRYSGFCQFKKLHGWLLHLLRGNSTSHQLISDHLTIILE